MAHNFQQDFDALLRLQQQQHQQQQQQQQHVPITEFPQQSLMPMPIPYNVQNMPWAQHKLPVSMPNVGNVMQFNACNNFLDENTRRALLHVKRKSEPPIIEPPPKQFISEEKITAHFNGLHISNENKSTSNQFIDDDDSGMSTSNFIDTDSSEYKVTAKELEEKLRKASRITLCEDLKKLHEEQKKASLLPEALINRIEKPCTALVLWQPPPILELIHRKTEEELQRAEKNHTTAVGTSNNEDLVEDVEFSDVETEEIDDFIDNNNTCLLDYNANGEMDEDL